MIHIEATSSEKNTIDLWVDGRIDSKTLSVLKNACKRRLEGTKRVVLHLGGIVHISKEGKEFLMEMQPQIMFADVPEYLQIDMQYTAKE